MVGSVKNINNKSVTSLDQKIEVAIETMDRAIAEHNPSCVFALFSGGHDSLVSSHIASLHPRFSAVVHINTGIGIPETREFVYRTCDRFNWELLEYKASENTKADGTPDPQIYEDLVLAQGFPGAYLHKKMYQRLKERQIDRLVRDHKRVRRDRILLTTGVRKDESKRRLRNITASGTIDRRGTSVWVNPIADFTAENCSEYMRRFDLPKNPVKALLCMSGECLCGAFAKKGELEIIEACYPETGRYLRDLEQRVKEKFPWGWDESPPDWWLQYKKGQNFIPGLEQEFLPLCHSCIAKEAV